VIDPITADDAINEQIIGQMFGDDWPTKLPEALAARLLDAAQERPSPKGCRSPP
jgi:hypothetical protein